MARVALVLVASCSWLPPDKPAQPVAVDELSHIWIVENHAMTGSPAITELDANELHGRRVDITGGYQTPWQGSCEDAHRDRRERGAADLSIALDLTGDAWDRVRRFGITGMITEYKLTCTDRGAPKPPLVMFVSGNRAMTCANGVCYLMSR